MAAANWQLNQFERILFRIAILVGAILVAVRVGAMVALWFVHHR